MIAPLLLPSALFPMVESLNQPGNAVHIRGEDMRFAKKVREIGLDGKDYLVERGPVVYETAYKNLVMDAMRKNALEDAFYSSVITAAGYGGVGSDGSTPTDASLAHLVSENIAGTNRKGLTDILGGALSSPGTQIVSDVSGSDRWKIVVQYVYDAVDADLDGATFAEYGMFDTQACPGTTTGTSGKLLFRYVPVSSFTKQSGIKVTIQWTVRA